MNWLFKISTVDKMLLMNDSFHLPKRTYNKICKEKVMWNKKDFIDQSLSVFVGR